jgi:hypothetical protein
MKIWKIESSICVFSFSSKTVTIPTDSETQTACCEKDKLRENQSRVMKSFLRKYKRKI